MKITGSDIHMIRGDTESLTVTCELEDGTARPFEDGDRVTLTIAYPWGQEVLQKTAAAFQDGAAMFALSHEDTNSLTPEWYRYDVQLTTAEGMVKTIIGPAVWEIGGDVTRE